MGPPAEWMLEYAGVSFGPDSLTLHNILLYFILF